MDPDSAAYDAGYEMGYAVGGFIGCLAMVIIPILFILSLIFAIIKKSKGWTIVCVLSGLAGLGLIALAVFGIITAQKEAGKPRAIPSNDGLVELTGPKSWKDLSTMLGVEDASVQIGNIFQEEYLVVISEPKSDFDDDFTTKDYTELIRELNLEGTDQSTDETALNPIQVNGLDGFQYEFQARIDGLDIVYLMTIVGGKDHFHQVMAWTMPSKKAVAFPKFRDAAATFRERAK
ncbi:MAG: hypothetical protein HKN23_17860 [Verrucomicrobiales bacterium]|nr:hypothetical protein [Verrucomicrobiales bacterium]